MHLPDATAELPPFLADVTSGMRLLQRLSRPELRPSKLEKQNDAKRGPDNLTISVCYSSDNEFFLSRQGHADGPRHPDRPKSSHYISGARQDRGNPTGCG
jgi:hypothetical protein